MRVLVALLCYWHWCFFILAIDAYLLTENGTDHEEEESIGSCQAISWLHPCESNGYDNMISPQRWVNGSTTPVRIQIYVESMGNFKAGTMDYDMDLYFVEWWHDDRLRHNYSTFLSFNDQELLSRLWLPDLYFANSKTAQYNFVTIPNLVLKLYPNGDIRYSVRINMKVTCNMNLESYPLDIQRCFLKIVSYGSTTDMMRVSWINGSDAIEMNPDIQPTDLKVYKVEHGYCNGSYFNMEFTCLLATFYMRRDLGYSLLQLFIPTTFIVIISWISFWIDPTSVPGRVGLAVTTLLTLSTQAIGLQYALPPVSYMKAQDVWFGMCILFLFAALVEFALVNMLARRAEDMDKRLRGAVKISAKPRIRKPSPINNNNSTKPPDFMCCLRVNELLLNRIVLPHAMGDLESLHRTCLIYRRRVECVDRLSRWLFPISFFLFCVAYFYVYVEVMRPDYTVMMDSS